MKNISEFISSGFGAGYIPKAPGTWGSLLGLLLLVFLNYLVPGKAEIFLPGLIIVYGLMAYIAIRNLPATWEHDDQKIVSDEILGIFITFLFLPLCWKNLLAGFVLFRILDIFKPLGIRAIDRWPSKVGVLADDVLAAVYANLILQAFFLFLPLCQ